MQPEYLHLSTNGFDRRIAVRYRKAAPGNEDGPGLFWLGGYRSDMLGGKATTLDEWAQKNGTACCRFDYAGHGESSGDFYQGTITFWLEDALAVLDKYATGPQILVGSSMGCWIALRMAQELAKRGNEGRLDGMILIAPAPDFTKELTWPQLSEAQKRSVIEKGVLEEPTDDPEWKTIYTKNLFDDGENNLVMTGMIETGCPVHIIQGGADDVVPTSHAMKLAELLPSENVTMTVIKDGDHRLSRPEDLEVLVRAIGEMM